MARYATGKKSKAISDITGFKVNYPQLKTTWDNLRVEPEEFDIKHHQLTPAKNVFDATALALNKLNTLLDASTRVTSIVVPDPASSDTNIDFMIAVVAVGTVYSVVADVVVRSTFLFTNELAKEKSLRL